MRSVTRPSWLATSHISVTSSSRVSFSLFSSECPNLFLRGVCRVIHSPGYAYVRRCSVRPARRWARSLTPGSTSRSHRSDCVSRGPESCQRDLSRERGSPPSGPCRIDRRGRRDTLVPKGLKVASSVARSLSRRRASH
ncbi:Hypothetical predicted protein [Olea europaea subsp. europaea]|uniref:Uncharacterized protein n=1 Tax=Olea europaea subsp. europaea TaxID=158383 RepID=A0A8S0RBN0_OLEEU|nr:Hypothetical predicted protein [Olea europaea subsp. europaea]